METLLYRPSSKETEKKLRSFLMEVAEDVHDLNRNFEAIIAKYRRKNV